MGAAYSSLGRPACTSTQSDQCFCYSLSRKVFVCVDTLCPNFYVPNFMSQFVIHFPEKFLFELILYINNF